MPGYHTRLLTLHLGRHDYRIRALSDLQQYADPYGEAALAGISSAQWSLFGQVWPSGRVLAEAMSDFMVAGKRILEIGCGLGLSSLVLQRRGAEVIASDHHPLAETFLNHNAGLNGLRPMDYRDLAWAQPHPALGRFDLIIGSDILYERDHASLLSDLLHRHAKPHAELLITDPGRGNSALFSRLMAAQGYAMNQQRSRFNEADTPPYRGQLLSYTR